MDPWRRLETCLSELVDYRRIHGTTCSLPMERKHETGFYSADKGRSTGCNLAGKTSHMTASESSIGRHRVF
jgi:hypothetical protein